MARHLDCRDMGVVQSLPLVAMWHETLATNETLQYVAIHGTREEQQRTRQLLYARYAMTLGGEIAGISTPSGVAIGNVFQVVGAVGGHATVLIENRR